MADLAQIAPGARTWKLTLSYDGTGFHGWQVQPGRPTIQGELQAALGRVTGESPLPQGSGRTDAGVHALAQVASFALRAPIPAENLQRALNRTLPRRSASPKRERHEVPRFMHGIRPSPRLMSTASFAAKFVPPSWPATSTPVPGRSIWMRSQNPRASSSASMTSRALLRQTPM